MKQNAINNQNFITIKGARAHNLKNVDITIPKNKIIVFTGLSGSGKSSLAFDTIYAEGQRRYVESLSTYARQFLGMADKPDVDYIGGLAPAISIDQKTTSHNPRSTVGTTTEIYDYLRLLFARVGKAYCPHGHGLIERQTSKEVLQQILTYENGTSILILSPIIKKQKGTHKLELDNLRKDGFLRVRINGNIYSLDDEINLEKNKSHDIEIVVDRVILDKTDDNIARLSEALEVGFQYSKGYLLVSNVDTKEDKLYSKHHSCKVCGFSLPELEPRLFSFNSPIGACQKCNGIGAILQYDEEKIVEFPDKSIKGGAIPFIKNEKDLITGYEYEMCAAVCNHYNISLDTPYNELTEKERIIIMEGTNEEITYQVISNRSSVSRTGLIEGIGLTYLELSRNSSTLSGGESQRIRLATQIGSQLSGVLYVLDEPSIGLHQRDNGKLIKTLKEMRDLGNTLIVVEHDEETMLEADHVIDIGPGAGVHGGKVVFSGTYEEILNSDESITGQYLSGKKKIEIPNKRRIEPTRYIELIGCQENNLKNISVKIPLKRFVAVTGVSGSGKSTLINEIFTKAVQKSLHLKVSNIGKYSSVKGLDQIDKIINISQDPIGRTPRSNPATYTNLFTYIRDLFANAVEAKAQGFVKGRFSFNVAGGRCERCCGEGFLKISMHFLPDVYVVCEECHGKRFNEATLKIKYRGKNIYDVLQLTVEEALEFFQNHPQLKNGIQTLCDVGLGYIKLGQPATELSGGEAQRVKLASELLKKATGKTVYVLDEPTTGLHFEDINKLLKILQRIVDHGDSVIVIEHNLDVIKCVDHVIDMGPEGGRLGGIVVAQGTPEEIADNPKSITGQFIRSVLNKQR
uniref:ABC transporter domain-containing protein n=1 Tax=Biomphalaria glabrata TaxID=6526 RepID=A0A2C9LUI0_BIOGL